ncbi:hypothetical protein B7486_12760 [cyanobacterium TDX16]|nr:hypothetical protein B7486_12760 [cyanobacterium TDX16]
MLTVAIFFGLVFVFFVGMQILGPASAESGSSVSETGGTGNSPIGTSVFRRIAGIFLFLVVVFCFWMSGHLERKLKRFLADVRQLFR